MNKQNLFENELFFIQYKNKTSSLLLNKNLIEYLMVINNENFK